MKVVHKPSTSPHQVIPSSRVFFLFSFLFLFLPLPLLFSTRLLSTFEIKAAHFMHPFPPHIETNRRTSYNFHSRKRGRFARVRRCFPDFRPTSVEQRGSRVSSRIDLFNPIHSLPRDLLHPPSSSPILMLFLSRKRRKKKRANRKKE